MQKCPNCFTECSDSEQFCPACGTRLNNQENSSASSGGYGAVPNPSGKGPAKKCSKGTLFIIILCVVFIGAAAGGVGWYFLSKHNEETRLSELFSQYDEVIARADKALESGDYADAEKLYWEAIDVVHDGAAAYIGLYEIAKATENEALMENAMKEMNSALMGEQLDLFKKAKKELDQKYPD